jgi:hypothetical protein
MVKTTDTFIAALSEVKTMVSPKRFTLSEHATGRFIQRVAPTTPTDEAIQLLEALVSHGRVRSTPRWWMKHRVNLTPGLRFIYWSSLPNVCALAMGEVVVTVLTKKMLMKTTMLRTVTSANSPFISGISPKPPVQHIKRHAGYEMESYVPNELAPTADWVVHIPKPKYEMRRGSISA